MNSRKRAIIYIIRKKGKTASLLSLFFCMSFFLMSCFLIFNASRKLGNDIRTSVGGAFYIRGNTEVLSNKNGTVEVVENTVNISQQQVDEIMSTGKIKYCNPINYGFAKSAEIKFIPGDKDNKENNMGSVTALSFSALDSDFLNGKAVLIEGEHLTREDNKKIIISEELAQTNNILIGDFVTLIHARLGEQDDRYIDEIISKKFFSTVQVIGIYKYNGEDTAIKPTAAIAQNKIYSSLDVLNDLDECEKDIYSGEVDFYVVDPLDINNIVGNVHSISSIDWSKHFIRINDFKYSQIADRLTSITNLSEILICGITIISAIILILMLLMRMRARMREIGILLAAGVSKGDILAAFFWETVWIAIVAVLLGGTFSLISTKVYGNYLFSEMPSYLVNDNLLKMGLGEINVDTYFKIGVLKSGLIFLYQIVIILTSTIVPSVMIMKLSPKNILTKID